MCEVRLDRRIQFQMLSSNLFGGTQPIAERSCGATRIEGAALSTEA
jgi:hypothetical protein